MTVALPVVGRDVEPLGLLFFTGAQPHKRVHKSGKPPSHPQGKHDTQSHRAKLPLEQTLFHQSRSCGMRRLIHE